MRLKYSGSTDQCKSSEIPIGGDLPYLKELIQSHKSLPFRRIDLFSIPLIERCALGFAKLDLGFGGQRYGDVRARLA